MKPVHDIWRNTVTISCLEADVISCAALAIGFRLKVVPRVAKISLVAPVTFQCKNIKTYWWLSAFVRQHDAGNIAWYKFLL